MPKKRDAEPTPVLEFEEFYPLNGQIYVPYHCDTSGKPRLLYMSPATVAQGVSLAMRYIGGNVIPMARRIIRRSEEKATG